MLTMYKAYDNAHIYLYLTLLILLFCTIGCENTDNPIDDMSTTKGTLSGEMLSHPTSETETIPGQGLQSGQGLNIGSRAPEFELPDGNGNLHSLSHYLSNNKSVVLVFYRFGG